MPSVNLSFWSLSCLCMVVKPIEGILCSSYIVSTRISCMLSPNSTSVSTPASQGSHCMRRLFISSSILHLRHSRLFGLLRLISNVREIDHLTLKHSTFCLMSIRMIIEEEMKTISWETPCFTRKEWNLNALVKCKCLNGFATDSGMRSLSTICASGHSVFNKMAGILLIKLTEKV